MSLGFLNTGIITLVLTLINNGLSETFLGLWITAWLIAYVIVVPVSLSASPIIQAKIDNLYS
jgi:hypothetical protein